VRVRDLARAVRFYRALGLRTVARGRMKDGTKLAWMRDPGTGQLVELFCLSPRSPLYVPFPRRGRAEGSLIFSVDRMAPLRSRLVRSGAKPVREFEDGGVRLSFLRDPDGTLLEFLSWAQPSPRAARATPLLRLTRGRPKVRRER
jgi:catechol 2,3-dioxygenase-like lactoylglutathione lyase family enzyme